MACSWVSKKWTFRQEVPEDTSASKTATVKTNANTKTETEQAISEQKQHDKKLMQIHLITVFTTGN